MPATARLFGLSVSPRTDERLFVSGTRGAAAILHNPSTTIFSQDENYRMIEDKIHLVKTRTATQSGRCFCLNKESRIGEIIMSVVETELAFF